MFDFNRWRANVALPLVFGDSLSFMEMVSKLRYAIENIGNSVVEAIGDVNDTIDETVDLVNAQSNAIDDLGDNLEIVETNLGETQQDVVNLQNEVEHGIGFKRIAFLGDSFAYSETTWATQVAHNLGNTNYVLVKDSAVRFLTPSGDTSVDANNIQTFADLLAANFTYIESSLGGFPTDVVVGCGINDSNLIEGYNVTQGIINFITTARTRWSNCKIHIVAIGWAQSWVQRKNLKSVYSQYESATGFYANANIYRAYYGCMNRTYLTNGVLNNAGAYSVGMCMAAALLGNDSTCAGFDALQQVDDVMVPVVKYGGGDTFHVHITGGDYRLTVDASDWALVRNGSQTFFYGSDDGFADVICPIHEYAAAVGNDPPAVETDTKILVFRIRTVNGSTGLYAKALSSADEVSNKDCVIPNINYSVDSFSV